MPEINDAILLNEAGDPENPAAGMARMEPVRGHEVVDEVWEEKSDKDINIIPCTSISFAQGETLELQPGQTKMLEVVQDPFLSNIPYLTFESSDLNVIQIIDDCVAYACGEEGEAIVTASSSDGTNLSASITITVAAKKTEDGGDEPAPEPEPEEGKGEFTFITQLRKYDTKEVINEDVASIMVEEKPVESEEGEVTTQSVSKSKKK